MGLHWHITVNVNSLAGISTEFCGAISTQFCFTYSLGGVNAMPHGLHSTLCQAFLLLHKMLDCNMAYSCTYCSCRYVGWAFSRNKLSYIWSCVHTGMQRNSRQCMAPCSTGSTVQQHSQRSGAVRCRALSRAALRCMPAWMQLECMRASQIDSVIAAIGLLGNIRQFSFALYLFFRRQISLFHRSSQFLGHCSI